MIRLIILAVVLSGILACSKSYSLDSVDWKIIDVKYFTISVPSDFEYKPQRGIDSFVGKISNGRIEISFDHGWYSNPGPTTIIDQWLKRTPYTRLIKDETLLKYRSISSIDDYDFDSLRLVSISTVTMSGKQAYILSFQDADGVMLDTLPFGQLQTYDDNFLDYKVEYAFNECTFLKKYVSTTGKTNAGIYTFRQCNLSENFAMTTKLGVFVNDYREEEVEVIEKILNSVIMNE